MTLVGVRFSIRSQVSTWSITEKGSKIIKAKDNRPYYHSGNALTFKTAQTFNYLKVSVIFTVCSFSAFSMFRDV